MDSDHPALKFSFCFCFFLVRMLTFCCVRIHPRFHRSPTRLKVRKHSKNRKEVRSRFHCILFFRANCDASRALRSASNFSRLSTVCVYSGIVKAYAHYRSVTTFVMGTSLGELFNVGFPVCLVTVIPPGKACSSFECRCNLCCIPSWRPCDFPFYSLQCI